MSPLAPAHARRHSPRVVIPRDRGTDAMTFRDFARECCKQMDQWGYSDQTVEKYDRAYMQFLAYVKAQGAHDDVRSFNDRLVFGFATNLAKQGIHPNTIITTLSALSTLARYGMETRDLKDRRRISEDPTKSFRWPQAQKQETKYLYPAEVRRLVDADLPEYKRRALDVLMELGIRAGETARLDVGHLKCVEGRYFLALIVKRRGDRRKVYTVDTPISKTLGEALSQAVALRPEHQQAHDQPLLRNSEGARWGTKALSSMVARVAAGVGILRLRVSAHKLRHTREVIDRRAGLDQATRARLRARSSMRSLERYEHVLPEELPGAREIANQGMRDYIGDPVLAMPEEGGMERKVHSATTPPNPAIEQEEGEV